MSLYEGVSLVSDKQPVIIDIGSRYTKVGFAGEVAPRCIVRTEVTCPHTGQLRRIFDATSRQEQYDLLVELIHTLYFRYLLVSPKDRQVVIVESLLCPSAFRETLAEVFFKHFEVASLMLVPSHVVALRTLGVNSALVVDIGAAETVVIPVYEGVAVLHAWQAQPLAGCAVERSLAALLKLDNSERSDNVMEDITSEDIEDIKVRTCFVTTLSRAQKAENGTPCQPPPSVDYHIGRNSTTINISGQTREHAYEVLFEQDADRISVPTMIINAILKCPRDMRKVLSENILLMGGTAMAPGLCARIQQELYHQISRPPYEKTFKVRTFKFHTAAAKENYTAWLGGAIYGATDWINTRSLTKKTYIAEKRVPDWVNLIDNVEVPGTKRSL